jgi:PPE-repeat protein
VRKRGGNRQTDAASSLAPPIAHRGRGCGEARVTMDLGALPPEINSGRLYSGPGSGPMLTAAEAWSRLVDDLYTAAACYDWVVCGLTSEGWLGPASLGMAVAIAPYVTWMRATAALAEQSAAQARQAATAYEVALVMSVPPPVIAANRARYRLLAATNVVGQYAHAIAATERHYNEMWAQDAAAMYRYAASSAVAATLAPYLPPRVTTNPARTSGSAAPVVDHTLSTRATLSGLMSIVPQALQKLARPSQASLPRSAVSTVVPARSMKTTVPFAAAQEPLVVSAGRGNAASVTGLSVPQRWKTAAVAGHPLSGAAPSGNVVPDALTETPIILSTGTAGYFVGAPARRSRHAMKSSTTGG